MHQLDEDAEEADNTAAMKQAMGAVTTLEVTYAARDSEFDGKQIRQGDYLALKDNHLFGTHANLEVLLQEMAQAVADKGAEFITVFYGEDVEESAAQQAAEHFLAACPDAELTLLLGGQPVYADLISAE